MKPKESLFNEFYPKLSLQSSFPRLDFPKMPSFLELVEKDSLPSPAKKDPGLFKVLVGAVEPLYVDAQENPDKYSDAGKELLTSLVSGQRKLTELSEEEQHLLDQASFDFVSVPPPKPKLIPIKQVEDADDEDDEDKEKEASSFEADLPSYWWA